MKKAVKMHFADLFKKQHVHSSLYLEIFFNIISTELKKNIDKMISSAVAMVFHGWNQWALILAKYIYKGVRC